MKRIIYIILLIAELFVGSLLMISLWDAMFYIPIAAYAVVACLLIWQLVWYFKSNNPKAKRKILRNIALIMFIPIAVFIASYVVFAIAFIIEFS